MEVSILEDMSAVSTMGDMVAVPTMGNRVAVSTMGDMAALPTNLVINEILRLDLYLTLKMVVD